MIRDTWSRICGRLSGEDRRIRFRDLRFIAPRDRTPASDVIQFYSSNDNIGNYLPILAIQLMLPFPTDLWCAHDRAIDWSFIERHYRCAIVGGAGLLDDCFAPFWKQLSERCRLPLVFWGLGGSWPDEPRSTLACAPFVREVTGRCGPVNLRDDLSAERFAMREAAITPCPSILYLKSFGIQKRAPADPILHVSHRKLASMAVQRGIEAQLKRARVHRLFTDNVQKRHEGLEDLIREKYGRARAVVTTRLHGAIVAYGMRLPYLAVARDDKLRAFARLFGGGVLTDDVGRVADRVEEAAAMTVAPSYEGVEEFGRRALAWLKEQNASGRPLNHGRR